MDKDYEEKLRVFICQACHFEFSDPKAKVWEGVKTIEVAGRCPRCKVVTPKIVFKDPATGFSVYTHKEGTMSTKAKSNVKAGDAKKADQAPALETFHCMKCQTKRQSAFTVKTLKNGARQAVGKCPKCGTALYKFLPRVVQGTGSLSPEKPSSKDEKVSFVLAHSDKGKATLANVAKMSPAALDKWIASYKQQEEGKKAVVAKTSEHQRGKAAKGKSNGSKPSENGNGKRVFEISLTPEQAKAKATKVVKEMEPRGSKHYVNISGKHIGPKELLSVLTGHPTDSFSGSWARKQVSSLGFKLEKA